MKLKTLSDKEKVKWVKQAIKDAVGSDYDIMQLVKKIIYDK